MAIPPTMFPTVAESLASVGLNERGRIVVEKPFGRDLQSARELNATLHTVFPEERIFRIDHYLGKESVEDLLVFRFSNTLLEPIWNRNYVRSVQITMSETIGVEGRGAFYDSVGAIRDVLQNHLLQVVALLAMEPPVGPESQLPAGREGQGAGGDAAARSATRSCAASTSATATSRASHPTRRSRRSPPPGSRSTRGDGPACRGTCASARRWRRRPPRPWSSSTRRRACCSTRPAGPTPGRNLVRLRLGKRDGVTFTLQAKTPGQHLDSQAVDIAVDFAAALGERQRGVRAAARRRDRRLAAPLRPPGRRRADVARSCSRRSTTPARCTRTSAARGARPRPTACSRPGDVWFEPERRTVVLIVRTSSRSRDMWIPITLAAATFQILRTSRTARAARPMLSPAAAGFVRFLYGAPFALALGAVWFGLLPHDLPDIEPRFWVVRGAGRDHPDRRHQRPAAGVPRARLRGRHRVLEVGGDRRRDRRRDRARRTACAARLARRRAGDARRRLAGRRRVVRVAAATRRRPGGVDGTAGRGRVRAGVGVHPRRLAHDGRRARLRPGTGDVDGDADDPDRRQHRWVRARRSAVELPKALRAWRPAVWVGLFSVLGSMGWAWAITLENAAKVRTLGQVELIMAFAIAHVKLGERHTRHDYAASARRARRRGDR